MKNMMSNYLNRRKLLLIVSLALIASFALFTDANAQSGRGFSGRGVKSRGFSGRGSMISMPRYNIHFAPRLGARLRFLPFGYTSFRLGSLQYFYIDGFYYRYFPDDRVYVVVEKPEGALNPRQNSKFDLVKMADGSTLEGIFQGATDRIITLQICDKNHDINIGDIVTITFASPAKDSTPQR